MKNVDINLVYREHANQVYVFLYRMCNDSYLAEDIMQDTFLKAMDKIDTFDGTCKLSTWLCQIAKNTYFDYLKKNRIHSDIEMIQEKLAGQERSPEEVFIVNETATEAKKHLQKLPEPYKDVFLLRHYAKLSFKEIGNTYGKSEVWGRVTYLRAKEMIINKMGK